MTLDLAYPKDDPAAVSDLVGRLTAEAGTLRGAQQRLLGHRAGIESSWKDPAGSRAAAEIGTVADLVHTGDAAFTTAAGALGTYRSAVEQARAEIDGLRRRHQAAVSDRAATLHRADGLPEPFRTSAVQQANSQLATAESAIQGEYEAVLQDVTRAATTAAGTISQLARPIGVQPGSTDPAGAVRARLEGTLLSLHQHTMQVKANEAADLAEKLPQLSDEELARLASYSQYAADPTFATTFQQRLGPHGLLQATGALTLMVPFPPQHTGREAAAGRIQQMFATTLATATDPSKEPHLDQAWIDELKAQGRQKTQFGSSERYG